MKILYFFLFLVVFVGVGNTHVWAQDVSDVPVVIASVTPTPTPLSVDYQLPYPGILPDNPLYVFKAIRDKMISFLVSDPLKKSQFDLLQADKRIAAAQTLSQEHKSAMLIASTVSKAENYFEESITQAQNAQKQKLFIGDMVRQLGQSADKHQEVIKEIEQGVSSSSIKKELVNDQARVEKFKKQASILQQSQ